MTYTETKVLDIFRAEGRVKELVSIVSHGIAHT